VKKYYETEPAPEVDKKYKAFLRGEITHEYLS
jgi:hypothetical protein